MLYYNSIKCLQREKLLFETVDGWINANIDKTTLGNLESFQRKKEITFKLNTNDKQEKNDREKCLRERKIEK